MNKLHVQGWKLSKSGEWDYDIGFDNFTESEYEYSKNNQSRKAGQMGDLATYQYDVQDSEGTVIDTFYSDEDLLS